MASDMFIKIDGIKGESNVDGHEGDIDVLSWSWGVSNSGSAHMGSGQGAGKASFSDLHFMKAMDKSSPSLYKASATGQHIKKATLAIRKASGDKPLEFITIDMEEILVTSVQTSGAGGDNNMITESVSLNFAKVKYKYIEQKADGSEGDKPDFNWDIRVHKAM